MNQIYVLRVRRWLHLLFALGAIFVFVENVSTYLGTTIRKGIAEVSTALLLINVWFGFGIEILCTHKP